MTGALPVALFFLCSAVREIHHRDFRHRLFHSLQNTLYLFYRICRQNDLTALFTLHTGDIFDDNDTVFELYGMNGSIRLHFALAEKAGHALFPFLLSFCIRGIPVVQVRPIGGQYPQRILMDAAHHLEPAARQIDAKYQTGWTPVVVRAIFDDFSALDSLPNISQTDAAFIKPGLRVCCQEYLPTAG